MNVFRKGDDFIIITELPGVKKSDLDVQVKGRTLRLSGVKSVDFPEKAAARHNIGEIEKDAARIPVRRKEVGEQTACPAAYVGDALDRTEIVGGHERCRERGAARRKNAGMHRSCADNARSDGSSRRGCFLR